MLNRSIMGDKTLAGSSAKRRWAGMHIGALLLGGVALVGLAVSPALAQSDDEGAGEKKSQRPLVEINKNPYPSTYAPLPSDLTAIVGATVLDGIGGRIEGGTVVMNGGDIVAVGADVDVPAGARVIDGTGKWVTLLMCIRI